MPFFISLLENPRPPSVFEKYPELYRPWAEINQALMNGPSPLSRTERELILAFEFVYVSHAQVAYEWGIEQGLVERLVEDFDNAPVAPKLSPL